MARKIRDTKSAGAGLIFIAFGVLAIVVASQYRLGSALRMGPGYFPLIVGGILVCFGAIQLGYSLMAADVPVPRFRIKPSFWVLAAILAFAATIESLGLVVATSLLVVMSRLGDEGFRWRDVILLCAALISISAVVFEYALSMPFHLWPE